MNTSKTSATPRYLEDHEVFTLEEYLAAVDPGVSPRTRYANLTNAVRRGQAYRIRRGLYASNIGAYRDKVPNVALVAAKVADDAAVSHHSALELFGVAHSPLRTVYFTTAHKIAQFEVRGYRFQRVAPPAVDPAILRRFETRERAGDVLVPATSRERTLVDCLREPRLAGGLEELLRSLGGFTSMSAELAWSYAEALGSPTAIARLGWALELFADEWRLQSDVLERMSASLGRGTYRLADTGQPADFAARWRLYVPAALPYDEWVRG
jgi:predicted transcriptional regulator of viral defense system